jgi:hypothetical protein
MTTNQEMTTRTRTRTRTIKMYATNCLGAMLAVAAMGAVADDAVKLPPVTVTENALAEEAPVGPYQQPEWTTARRFPTTRVYLQQPPGGMAVEQWVRSRFYEGQRAEHLFQEEFEIGLPHRFQFDFYENWVINNQGTAYHDSFAGEVRWAPADWGVWPANPALYAEYKVVDEGDDVAEFKLLLGDDLARGWHWGVNLIWEQELGGEEATELAGSAALSYSLIDRKLSLGAEAKYTSETTEGTRSDPEEKALLGPSLQWRPTVNTHVDLVPLFGLNDAAPDVESFLVFGYDFGSGHEKARAPLSTRSQ